MKKYTKPHVLTTLNAGVAIQHGTNHDKFNTMVTDSLSNPDSKSSTGGYPGDE